MIELYRAIVPTSKIINENWGQTYRARQGKMEWLSRQCERIMSNEALDNENCHFIMPAVFNEPIEKFRVICQIFRFGNRDFDPQNYATMFKPIIDKLVSHNYLLNDSFKNVRSVTYEGGGHEQWKERAVRFPNDGLPDELTYEWWLANVETKTDVLLRVIIEEVK